MANIVEPATGKVSLTLSQKGLNLAELDFSSFLGLSKEAKISDLLSVLQYNLYH